MDSLYISSSFLDNTFDLYGDDTFSDIKINNELDFNKTSGKKSISLESGFDQYNTEYRNENNLLPHSFDDNLFSTEPDMEPDGVLFLDPTNDHPFPDGVLYLSDDRQYVSADSHLSPQSSVPSAPLPEPANPFIDLHSSENDGDIYDALSNYMLTASPYVRDSTSFSFLGLSSQSLTNNGKDISFAPIQKNDFDLFASGSCGNGMANSYSSNPMKTGTPMNLFSNNYFSNNNTPVTAPLSNTPSNPNYLYSNSMSYGMNAAPSMPTSVESSTISYNSTPQNGLFSSGRTAPPISAYPSQSINLNTCINNPGIPANPTGVIPQSINPMGVPTTASTINSGVAYNPVVAPNNNSMNTGNITSASLLGNQNFKRPISSLGNRLNQIFSDSSREDYFKSALREQQLQRYRLKKMRRVYQRPVDVKRSQQAKKRERNSRGRFVVAT